MIFDKIFEITFLVIIGVILFFLVTNIPVGMSVWACYNSSLESFDDLEYKIRAQGWSGEALCQNKRVTIENLDTCLSESLSKAARRFMIVRNLSKSSVPQS